MHARSTAILLGLSLLAPVPALAGKRSEDKVDKSAPSTVEWQHSYSGAIKSAKKESKPLLFKFYTGWCPHCVRMDRTTWTDAKVGELAGSFIAAKVNADVEKVPVKRYGLTGYPTVVVAEPGGEEVFRLEGYKGAKAVATYLQTYLDNEDEIASAFGRLRERRNDPAALLALGRFYEKVGLRKSAVTRYEKAMKSAEGDQWLEACIGAGHCLWARKDFKAALKHVEKGLAQAGDSPPPRLLLTMGRLQAGLGRTQDARSWLGRVISEHAASPEAEEAREEIAKLPS